MKKSWVAIILLCCIALVLVLGWRFIPKNPHMFQDTSDTKPTNIVTSDQVKTLEACNDNNDCFQNFFENYTLQNGRNKAFTFFNDLIATDTKLTENCHYMFHGIGHGTLLLSGKNVEEAFSLGTSSNFLMTIPTCGNGYYHGIIEEFVTDIPSKERQVDVLKNICLPILQKDSQAAVDCYHGLGHAILAEEDGDVQKSVGICDKVTDNVKMISMCHTGVFMEMIRDVVADDKVKTFSMCESLPTPMQKAECFNQQSYLFDDFLNNKDAFLKNMKECEDNVKDIEDRIVCIRKAKF